MNDPHTASTPQSVVDLYRASFHAQPVVIARSPGRVEVLGNHTDYNQGVTLSAAIDKYLWIAMGPADPSQTIAMVSSHYAGIACISEFARQRRHRWTNYIVGVAALLSNEGYPVAPFRAAVHSAIPMGAGLSSSAALEVAAGMALARLFGFAISKERLAAIAQRAEHDFCGSKCGLLDQYTVLFGEEGKLLHIDYRTLERRTVALPPQRPALAVTPSGVVHSLGESAYNERRIECFRAAEFFSRNDPSVKALRDVTMEQLTAAQRSLHPADYRRALHVVGENSRVERGMALLACGDLAGFGQLLYESHESSRVNFENSCRELDLLIDIVQKVPGVYGARLSGGGFGGAAITILEPGASEALAAITTAEFKRLTNRDTTVHFASIAGGASIVG